MDRARKESFVTELRERMDRAPVLYLTDFTGLNVQAMTELRSSLKKSGAEYVVVKNRIAKRVFVESEELPDISDSLVGPTGFVFGYSG
jgi:large subunit ribosomal protein L10